MRTSKVRLTVLALAATTVLGVGMALAQQPAQPPRGGNQPRWDPQAMQQRAAQQMKERLQVTDEEWTVLQPKIEKVTTLSREVEGGMGMLMLGRGGRGNRGGQAGDTDAATPPQSPLVQARLALQTTLDNTNATPAEIQAKLVAFREAREKARQELATARNALRELVTPRQEAQLLLMGILD